MPSASRRDFLQHSMLAATGCVAHVFLNASCAPRRQRQRWTAPANPVIATAPFAQLEAVGADAWAVISTPLAGDRTTFANGGIIAGRNGVVVIEGFYRAAGAEWLAQQARALTGRWPTHAVITHYHVDHASGLGGYAGPDGTPRVHVTEATRRLALGGGPVAPARDAALERAFADVVVLPARGDSRIDLGNRTLVLQPFTGHTPSDLTIRDDDAALTWAGDLVWYRMFPNFVDASPTTLGASARALAGRMEAKHARLVPGHGAHITRSGMTEYLALLESIEAAARTGHAAGTPAVQVAAAYTVPASLGEWMASKVSLERAMQAWYRELP
jgi:glyoxylase-like metal-dependent hydrolase (beta-lactamase superfamily II)